MTVLCLIANCQLIQYAPRTAHGDGRRDGDFKWITILPGRALRMRRLQQYAQKTPSGWSLDFLQGSVEVEHRRPASSKVEYRASPEDDLLYFTRTKDHPTLRTSGLLGTGLPLLPVLCVPGHDPTSERIYTGHHRMESSPQRAGIARVGLVEGFSTGSVRHTTVITL